MGATSASAIGCREMSPELTEAEVVLAAARAHAEALGLAVSIAILDARADDVLVARMDGARYTAFEIARGKALVAATFGRPSADMADFADTPVGRRTDALNHGRMVYGRGAVVLLRADGTRVGAIGVSGALPEQDEEIASAGAAALRARESEGR
jgi:glc operon protein GlcG